MILVIDTALRQQIILGVIKDNKVRWSKFINQPNSKDCPLLIDQLLDEYQIKVRDLTAIFVNRGPGSYTGVRVGVMIANTLAWTLNVPVIGYQNEHFDETLSYFSPLPKHFEEVVLPIYDRELN